MAAPPSVAESYAAAIFTVAASEGVLDRVSDELFRFARIVEDNPELAQRLGDPGLDPGARMSLITELLRGRAHPQTISQLQYIVQSGRVRQLGEIVDAVVRRTAAARQHAVAEVRTAVPLDDATQQRLAKALSESSGREVEVKVLVDLDVVGGVVVRMGDTVIDGSVARRLTELRSRLVGA